VACWCWHVPGAGHVTKGMGWMVFLDRHLANCTRPCTAQPSQLREMGRQARCARGDARPVLSQVLEEDLLPVWQRAVADSTSEHL
jgi:hypothetical protein